MSLATGFEGSEFSFLEAAAVSLSLLAVGEVATADLNFLNLYFTCLFPCCKSFSSTF